MSDADRAPAGEAGYRCGEFELDLARRELRRDGARIDVQPKVFDLIALLVTERQRVLDKDELQDRIWPRQIITETALTRAVMKARKALDDDAERQRMIRTVHSRGYRFVGPVELLAEAEPELPAPFAEPEANGPALTDTADAPEPPPTALPTPARRRLMLQSLALLALLAVLLSWLWQRERVPVAEGGLRIAVMPVDNATGDASLDWMRLGLMSAVEQILSEGGNLPTVPASSVLEQAGSAVSGAPLAWLGALAERHGASHMVSAELRAAPGALRLSYRVLGADGSERRRSLTGADVQTLARGMGADLLSLFRADGARREIADDLVGETFLRGRALRLQGDLRGADALFALAAEQAPDAFWPRYEHALTRRDLGDHALAERLLGELLAEAREGGQDARLRAAANSLGIARMHAGELDQADTLFDEAAAAAVRLGDHQALATVFTNRSIVARRRGDLAAARAAAEQSLASYRDAGIAHPPGHIFNTLAQVAISEGRLEAARGYAQQAASAFRLVGNRRGEATATSTLGRLARLQGDFDEALRQGEAALALHRGTGERRGALSALLGLSRAAEASGDLQRAHDYAGQAVADAEALGDRPYRIDAALRIAQLDLAAGQWDAAEAGLSEPLAYFAEAREWLNLHQARLDLAELHWRRGEPAAALAVLQPAAEWARETGNRLLLARAQWLQGQLALAEGDPARALSLAEAGLLAAGEGAPGELLALLHCLKAEAQAAAQRWSEVEAPLAAARAAAPWHPLPAWTAARLARQRGDEARAEVLEAEARSRAGQRWLAPAS